jgi:hypothetical protein
VRRDDVMWKVRYNYQMAAWVVYKGGKRLAEIFPTRELALEAARQMNQN